MTKTCPDCKATVHTSATPAETLERIAELQYEAGMYKCLYENAQKCIAATPAEAAGRLTDAFVKHENHVAWAAATPAVGGEREALAHKAAMFAEGTRRQYERGNNKGDMWFFELWHFLGDIETILAQPASPLRGREALEKILQRLGGPYNSRDHDIRQIVKDALASPPEQPAADPATGREEIK